MITKEHITAGLRKNGGLLRPAINQDAEIHLFGQESQPDFKDGETRKVAKDGKEEDVVVSRIFPTTHFGFRKIIVERPLRLNFQASAERIARLEDQKDFQSLAQSKKKGAAGAREQAEGRALQDAVRTLVRALPGALLKERDEFERLLDGAAKKAAVKLPAPARKAILSALSERDETAAVCHDLRLAFMCTSESAPGHAYACMRGRGTCMQTGHGHELTSLHVRTSCACVQAGMRTRGRWTAAQVHVPATIRSWARAQRVGPFGDFVIRQSSLRGSAASLQASSSGSSPAA